MLSNRFFVVDNKLIKLDFSSSVISLYSLCKISRTVWSKIFKKTHSKITTPFKQSNSPSIFNDSIFLQSFPKEGIQLIKYFSTISFTTCTKASLHFLFFFLSNSKIILFITTINRRSKKYKFLQEI